MRLASFLAIVILAVRSFASEGGEHHGLDAHQTNIIIYQTINVAVLVVGLFFALKKPVQQHFLNTKKIFNESAERASNLKKAAEQERMEIQIRLSKLESTVEESISRARAEAADLKKALLAEAQETSKKVKVEAESSAKLEIQKAKNRLREQMIGEAVQMTSHQLTTKLSEDDQRRLQGEFIDHIKVVTQ